jgi:NCS1 family nucleobase:cation symporter-1
VPAVVIGIFGYRWIHRVMQVTIVITGLSIIVMFVQALRYGSLPAKETAMTTPTAGLFIAGAALLVIDMLSWAPFVSGYTRYLPVNTSGRRLFWAIYSGNVVATIAACSVGAYLAALLPSVAVDGPVPAIGKISGKWALVVMALSLINSDTLNAYTGAFQVLALGNMWRRFKSVSVMLRVVPFICVMAVGVAIAFLGYQHFVSNLSNFLNVLLVIFIPWSAVNLTDYFLVRRGNYDVTAFFIPDGVYGKFAWRGLLAYAIGLAAEWPFVSQLDYTGPLVKDLGGADISWIVGFFVSAIVYLVLVVSTATETGRHDRQQMAASSRW